MNVSSLRKRLMAAEAKLLVEKLTIERITVGEDGVVTSHIVDGNEVLDGMIGKEYEDREEPYDKRGAGKVDRLCIVRRIIAPKPHVGSDEEDEDGDE